ncbi:MAG: hypothetical protein OEZ13_06405 [Spirochaetia bacterium]|nr:hypothetical protein [Spirochaetia bacterium]
MKDKKIKFSKRLRVTGLLFLILLSSVYFCAQTELIDMALEEVGIMDESRWDEAKFGP